MLSSILSRFLLANYHPFFIGSACTLAYNQKKLKVENNIIYFEYEDVDEKEITNIFISPAFMTSYYIIKKVEQWRVENIYLTRTLAHNAMENYNTLSLSSIMLYGVLGSVGLSLLRKN